MDEENVVTSRLESVSEIDDVDSDRRDKDKTAQVARETANKGQPIATSPALIRMSHFLLILEQWSFIGRLDVIFFHLLELKLGCGSSSATDILSTGSAFSVRSIRTCSVHT